MSFEGLNCEQCCFATGKDDGLGSGRTECGADARGGAETMPDLQELDAGEAILVEVFELEFRNGMRGSNNEQCLRRLGNEGSWQLHLIQAGKRLREPG